MSEDKKKKTIPGIEKMKAYVNVLTDKSEGHTLIIDDKFYADFLILLERDGLNKTDFFRCAIHLYVANDRAMLDVVKEMKRLLGLSNKSFTDKKKCSLEKHRKIEKAFDRQEELEENFGITADDITEIFDSIEDDLLDF